MESRGDTPLTRDPRDTLLEELHTQDFQRELLGS